MIYFFEFCVNYQYICYKYYTIDYDTTILQLEKSKSRKKSMTLLARQTKGRQTMKKKLTILLLLTNYTHLSYSKLVIGDPNAAPDTTFSFNIGFVKYEDRTENSFARFWTATNDANISTMPNDTKKYGLSFVNQASSYVPPTAQIKAIPMTNDGDAIIFEEQNNTVVSTTEPNPIWGAAFSLFDLTVQKPIFVLQNQLNNLYSVYNIEHYEAPATGDNITQLLRYNFGSAEEIKAVKGFINGIYAAYSQGNFGTTTSNIALLERSQAHDSNNPNIGSPYLKLLASSPVSVNTRALIGDQNNPSLSSLGTAVGIDIVASRVFFYTQAVAAAGGVAIPIAQIFVSQDNQSSKNLLFGPIAPENVLPKTFDTAVSAQSGSQIKITAAKYMLTSTDLPYMIVARDSGTGPQTIYALPLMNRGAYAGMIADFNSVTTKFGSLKPTFVERYFTNVLSDPSQIAINSNPLLNQLQVGGSSTLPISSGNSIKQIFAVGDSVYAVIAQEYDANNAPGTYQSQAIFAPEGYIIGWTPWNRVLGSDKQMSYSFVDGKYLTGSYVAATTSSATPEFKSMYQTTFTASSNLSEFLTAAQGGLGGIQGIFNFNRYTQGFNNSLSMLISTAFNKVALGQTGYLNGGLFQIMPNPNVVGFSNKQINNQGPLIAAEISHDANNNHYIFAGGANGISVLTNDTTGVSWNGNLNSVNDLNSDQITWKKLGNFSFVKKLIWDTDYIYILTSNNLYRIKLEPNKFTLNSTEKLNIETVLKNTDVGSTTYFLDAIIDNNYCLLGTTSGLYRLTNNNLLKITIPGGLPAVSQITVIAPNNNASHSFKDLSNIIILNSTFGTQQSKIYRFAIQNEVIHMLPDTLVATAANLSQGIPSAFLTFDNFISSYFTDGSWNTAQSYYLGPNQPENSVATPFVMQLQSSIHSGQSSSQVIMPMLTTQPHFPFLRLTGNILNMIRETTSGALIMAGEFEAHTNA